MGCDMFFLAVWGITELIIAMIVASSVTAGASIVNARKARKSQERMSKRQRSEQKKESNLAIQAEKASRTPPEPKNQQLPVQTTPKTPEKRKGSLAIGRRGGKAGLRVGSSNYGARVT